MKRALFLDRDGVINVERNYVHRVEDFEFVPGIFDLGLRATELGYFIAVITNQAGIGRGYYSEDDFAALTRWMNARFREKGIEIGAVFFCPDHPEHGLGRYRRESFDRKPSPGMILRAAREHRLDLAASLLIGDKETDIAAGKAGGVGCNVLLQPGGSKVATAADRVIASLAEALPLLAAGGISAGDRK